MGFSPGSVSAVSITSLLGSAGAAGVPPTPEVFCNPDEVRVEVGTNRFVSFDPTINDRTSDFALITIDSLGEIPTAVGSAGVAANEVQLEIVDGYAGTFTFDYYVTTSTGASGTGTITVIVEGDTTLPSAIGVPDVISIGESELSVLFDVIANDVGTDAMEIAPGSLVQPTSGPTISIDPTGQLKVLRNSAAAGSYFGSYKPRLKNGAATGLDTQVRINVQANSVTAANFTVNVSTTAAQPFKIDVLARCSGSGPIEITPGSLSNPTGASDSAAISGSGASGFINYTRSTTPVGTYTMTYKVRLISATATEATGTITIKVASSWWPRSPIPGGRTHLSGPGYFDGSFGQWASAVGAPGAFTAQSMYRGQSETTWEGIWGGSHTESLSSLTNKAKSQTALGTTFWSTVQNNMEPDSCRICMVAELWPEPYSTSSKEGKRNSRAIYALLDNTADRNKLQAGYIRWGARIRKNLRALGWTDLDLLVCRISHEMNQSNLVQAYPETRALWRNFAETAYEWMREGFGDRLRFVHSPARNDKIGPYQDWMPQSANGGVDCCTVSYHPAGQVETLADYEKFTYDGWDSNSYCQTDALNAAIALNIGYANPEWQSRHEVKRDKNNKIIQYPCPIADVVMQQFTKYMRGIALDGLMAFETVFDQRVLNKNAFAEGDPYRDTPAAAPGKAAWSRMVDDFKAIHMGTPKGTPPKLDCTDFAVPLSGSSSSYVDANPIGNSTGTTGDPRISRIVSTTGGLQATINGSGANARVRITKNTATAGARKVIAEMTLDNKPYLTDVEITVNVT